MSEPVCDSSFQFLNFHVPITSSSFEMGEVLKGKVLTVLGSVSPSDLGFVLPHEHLMLDFVRGRLSTNYLEEDVEKLPLTMNNLGKIRQYPYSVASNLLTDSVEEVIDELKLYKEAGGGTVCDLSVSGRSRVEAFKSISQSTGVNIVCGTGFYIDSFLTDDQKNMTRDDLAKVMIDEIMTGIPGTDGIRCGIIGEIGTSWPLTVNEIRVLQASAQAQQETGAPLIIHPGRGTAAPFEIVDVLRNAGADLSRTVMSHLDRTLFDHRDFVRFAETGCLLEFDLFGTECSHYQLNPEVDMPSDAQRISVIKMLCDKGYSDRIFISHDVHSKHRMVKYGGHGYSHILQNIIPKMKDRGISDEDIEKITVKNPGKWLTFN